MMPQGSPPPPAGQLAHALRGEEEAVAINVSVVLCVVVSCRVVCLHNVFHT